MSDWTQLVGAAFTAAFALFAAIWLHSADLSTVSSGSQSLEVFLTAVLLSVKPTGFSLLVDVAAAILSGMVSIRTVGGNIAAGIFGFLFIYFFVSIMVNFLFVAPSMV